MSEAKPAAAAPVATPEQVAEHRAELIAEYGQFVAIAPITFNGAAAFYPGDSVPASNVARHKYDEQGLVAKVNTKAAQDVIRALHGNATVVAANAELPPHVSLGVPVKE